jgi:hypothetical protein
MERVAIATRSFSRLIKLICTMCAQSRVQIALNSITGVACHGHNGFQCSRAQSFLLSNPVATSV